MLGVTCEGAEMLCLGAAIELVGLVLVLVLVDGVVRFRAGVFKVESAGASIRELTDDDRGRATEGEHVGGSPETTASQYLEVINASTVALSALTASTQYDIDRLDQRLQHLLDSRFSEALAVARAEADDVRRELNDDLRRTAWRPVVGTLLAICGLVLSAWAQVAGPPPVAPEGAPSSRSGAVLHDPR